MKNTIKNIFMVENDPEDLWYQAAEMPASVPVVIDPAKCDGCNRCVNICQVDILVPSKRKGGPPEVLFPGECWYCGCCVTECPVEGAIVLRHPLMNRVNWVAKESLG